MHFFRNCCSVHVYVWMCLCVCLVNFTTVWICSVRLWFLYFQRPPHRKIRAFWGAVFRSSLIRTTGRNKSHAYSFFFPLVSRIQVSAQWDKKAGDRFTVEGRIILNQNLEPTPQVVNAISEQTVCFSCSASNYAIRHLCALPACNIQSWKHCKTLPCGPTKKRIRVKYATKYRLQNKQ